MTGIVRSRRDFIHQKFTALLLKHLDCKQTNQFQFVGNGTGDIDRFFGDRFRNSCRCDRDVQDVIAMHIFANRE